MSKININDTVYFRLTPEGEATWKKWHLIREMSVEELKIDASGYQSCQLWHLMQVLGASFHIGMGGTLLVQNNFYTKYPVQNILMVD